MDVPRPPQGTQARINIWNNKVYGVAGDWFNRTNYYILDNGEWKPYNEELLYIVYPLSNLLIKDGCDIETAFELDKNATVLYPGPITPTAESWIEHYKLLLPDNHYGLLVLVGIDSNNVDCWKGVAANWNKDDSRILVTFRGKWYKSSKYVSYYGLGDTAAKKALFYEFKNYGLKSGYCYADGYNIDSVINKLIENAYWIRKE